MIKLRYTLLMLILQLGAACGPAKPQAAIEGLSETSESSTTPVDNSEQSEAPTGAEALEFPGDSSTTSAYPSPEESSDSPGYPAPDGVNGSYPPPSIPTRSYDESKRFAFDGSLSLHVGETVVRGTGPAEVPIKIVDVSQVGESLAFGTIDADGTFEIELSESLELNHVIGIQLSDSGLEAEYRDAPGSSDLPMIGFILATAIVQP